MMQTSSSGRCNLCAMQPSLMDNNKMKVSRGDYNNQSAAVEAAQNRGGGCFGLHARRGHYRGRSDDR